MATKITRNVYSTLLLMVSLVLTLSSVSASEGINFTHPATYVIIAAIWLVLLSIGIVVFGKKLQDKEGLKKFLFWIIVIPVAAASIYLAGFTVYENIVSESKGPIHWHMDYQVWACGERLDLINPDFPRNKIGTPLFHEHDDDRIHVEGTVQRFADITLGSYFRTIGGELNENPGSLAFHTEDQGILRYKDGDQCPDGSTGTLKVYINGQRADTYVDYLYYPDALVPPGDCGIIVFDSSDADTTDLICESWSVQGWDYDNYKENRQDVTIGEYSWE